MDHQTGNGSVRAEDRERIRLAIIDSLATDGSPEVILASILSALLAELVDSAAIDLVQDDGSLERVLTRHVDSETEQVLAQQRNENPLPMTASYGYPRVIKTGKSQFIPGVSERIAGRLFPVADLILDGVAIRSYICVPLVARGRVLGALTLLTTGSGRSFEGEDLLFFEELATIIAESLDPGMRK